ncbi:hypothetical protein (mitochondrion) [Candida oxycetoniae]|uniref:DNA polymerase n=1 Tax=Candida oxycetoniae TaxID=497107 RepID=S5TEL6_9ASCO|nr:hypothetical protein [Candida oxycetoniae]AGS44309.1 hypothetical protein [Candida oxycetoniae]
MFKFLINSIRFEYNNISYSYFIRMFTHSNFMSNNNNNSNNNTKLEIIDTSLKYSLYFKLSSFSRATLETELLKLIPSDNLNRYFNVSCVLYTDLGNGMGDSFYTVNTESVLVNIHNISDVYDTIFLSLDSMVDNYGCDYSSLVKDIKNCDSYIKVNLNENLEVIKYINENSIITNNISNSIRSTDYNNIKTSFERKKIPLCFDIGSVSNLIDKSNLGNVYSRFLINACNNNLINYVINDKNKLLTEMKSVFNNENSSLYEFVWKFNNIDSVSGLLVLPCVDPNKHTIYVFNVRNNVVVIRNCVYDELLSDNRIIRSINNTSLVIDKGQYVFLKIDNYLTTFSKYLKNVKNDLILENVKYNKIAKKGSTPSIGSFDIETARIGDDYVVIALGYSCFNSFLRSLYYRDYINDINYNIFSIYNYMISSIKRINYKEISNIMVIDCLRKMLTDYNDYTFYCHNFGKFDSIYILNSILIHNKNNPLDIFNCEFLYRDNILIKLTVSIKIDDNIHKIHFLDSYVLLTNSLSKLANDFNINESKGYFPYSFVNESTLDYVGTTPSIEYYPNISNDEYNEIYKTNYSLKDDLLNYLKQDLKVLLLIMECFRNTLYVSFRIDLIKNPTISRLSLNVFKQLFSKDYMSIPEVNVHNVYTFVSKTLFGGITTVYKPYGKDLYYYDINSFYPFSALNKMPGNRYTFIAYKTPILITDIEKSIFNFDNNIGYFKAYVESPLDLPFGLLPYKTDNGVLYPLGNFNGYWTSVELKLALDNGYKIYIYEGYVFNTMNSPFTNYVNHFYMLKSRCSGADRVLFKSLLNNLIGRLGIKHNHKRTFLLDKPIFDLLSIGYKLENTHEIVDSYLITSNFRPKMSKILDNIDINKYYSASSEWLANNKVKTKTPIYKESSVIMTSIINSYSRVYLNKLKLHLLSLGYTLYYCDTDSLIIDKELPSEYVGTELGQFKLEHTISEGYFISGKLYHLINNDGSIKSVAKGITESLTTNDYKDLLNRINVSADKLSSIRHYSEGYVSIDNMKIVINHDSFDKRRKIYINNIWSDTTPIIINEEIL